MLDFFVSAIPGIRRNPRNSTINTITAIAGIVVLVLAAAEANQKLLVIKDYASRPVLHATGSGTLTMSGAHIMKGGALTVTALASCNTIDTNSAGLFACGTDEGAGGGLSTSTGSLQTYFNRVFVQIPGDTMTGGLLIVDDGLGTQAIDAGLLLEVAGNMSGRTLFTANSLSTSGSLSVNGASIVKNSLRARGTLSGTTLRGDSLVSCTNVQTSAAGVLSCNTSTYLTTIGAGQGLTLIGTSALRLNATITGSLVRFTTLSGTNIYAKDSLFSSGALAVETTGVFQGNLTTRGTLSGALVNAGGGNFTVSNTALVFNENSLDADLRIESDGNANMLFVDASTNRVGVATNIPETTLEVVGTASGDYLVSPHSPSPSCPVFSYGTGSTAMRTGSGLIPFTLPPTMSGSVVFRAWAKVYWSGVTGNATIQLRNVTKKRHMFSTPITIESTETGSNTAATPVVISAANDDSSGEDMLAIDIPSIQTGVAAKGLSVGLCFQRP